MKIANAFAGVSLFCGGIVVFQAIGKWPLIMKSILLISVIALIVITNFVTWNETANLTIDKLHAMYPGYNHTAEQLANAQTDAWWGKVMLGGSSLLFVLIYSLGAGKNCVALRIAHTATSCTVVLGFILGIVLLICAPPLFWFSDEVSSRDAIVGSLVCPIGAFIVFGLMGSQIREMRKLGSEITRYPNE